MVEENPASERETTSQDLFTYYWDRMVQTIRLTVGKTSVQNRCRLAIYCTRHRQQALPLRLPLACNEMKRVNDGIVESDLIGRRREFLPNLGSISAYISLIFMYRVTIQLVTNLPLTSKQKFHFGLARPLHARLKQNLCFEVNGRFVTS